MLIEFFLLFLFLSFRISKTITHMSYCVIQLQHPMTIHVYHPYRQPDGENRCQAVNGHCSHLCLPAPTINEHSAKISCACPTGLKLMDDGLMCVEDGKCYKKKFNWLREKKKCWKIVQIFNHQWSLIRTTIYQRFFFETFLWLLRREGKLIEKVFLSHLYGGAYTFFSFFGISWKLFLYLLCMYTIAIILFCRINMKLIDFFDIMENVSSFAPWTPIFCTIYNKS